MPSYRSCSEIDYRPDGLEWLTYDSLLVEIASDALELDEQSEDFPHVALGHLALMYDFVHQSFSFTMYGSNYPLQTKQLQSEIIGAFDCAKRRTSRFEHEPPLEMTLKAELFTQASEMLLYSIETDGKNQIVDYAMAL